MALYKWSIRLAGIGSFPDQIQYMSQDDYNALSEEAKMNGTTYGIIGTAESGWTTYEDVSQYIRNHTFSSWTLWDWGVATKDWYVQIKASWNPIQTLYINWINMWSQSHDNNWWRAYWTPVRFYEWDVITWWSMDIYYQDD